MTRSRTTDPRRLDVAAFAAARGELDGHWPLAGFARLATAMSVGAGDAAGADSTVAWHVTGERAVLAAAGPQALLALAADADVTLECQRCLQPMRLPLQVRRRVFFIDGEDAAAQLDADSEDDVLALVPSLDLHGLVEDELILALPIIPRHEVCPEPLAAPDDGAADEAAEHPFAALATLRRGVLPS